MERCASVVKVNLMGTVFGASLLVAGASVHRLGLKQLDVVSVGMDDFLLLEKAVPLSGMFVNQTGGKITTARLTGTRR